MGIVRLTERGWRVAFMADGQARIPRARPKLPPTKHNREPVALLAALDYADEETRVDASGH